MTKIQNYQRMFLYNLGGKLWGRNKWMILGSVCLKKTGQWATKFPTHNGEFNAYSWFRNFFVVQIERKPSIQSNIPVQMWKIFCNLRLVKQTKDLIVASNFHNLPADRALIRNTFSITEMKRHVVVHGLGKHQFNLRLCIFCHNLANIHMLCWQYIVSI